MLWSLNWTHRKLESAFQRKHCWGIGISLWLAIKRVASCLLRDLAFYMIWGLSSDWSRIFKNLWKKNKSSLNKQLVVCHLRPMLVSRLHLPSRGLVSDQPFWWLWLTCTSCSPCIPDTLHKLSVAESILRCCCDVAAHCAWGPPCFFPATCFRAVLLLKLEVLSSCVAILLLDGWANFCVSQSDATLPSKTSAFTTAAWNTLCCLNV